MLERIKSSASLALGLKVPFMVTHHLTFRCNLDCAMCGLKLLPPIKELSTDECVDLQRDFRIHGTKVWGYSGGEPLVREDLEQLLASAKALGMRTVLNTNGTLLPDRPTLGHLVDLLEIGIDGGKRSHDALRGSGSFDQAVAGLEAMKRLESPRPRIVIQAILSNTSIEPDQLDEVLHLAKEQGVAVGFSLSMAHRVDDRLLDSTRKHTPSAEQFEVFLAWIEREKAGPRGKHIADDPAFFRALGDFPEHPRGIACQAGVRRCVVDPAGLVLPCADLFDRQVNLVARGQRFGSGYEGFKSLPKAYPCGKQYCYTAKTNFILGRPWRTLERYFSRADGSE
jgi:MoaA/NifB/PqqE/SkfB family radical SAM enzyme